MKKVSLTLADLQAHILGELWENAAFNRNAYEKLEKLITELAQANDLSAIHSSENFYELSTLRNRNLITHEEQDILRNTVVGFFGMSVGSNAAVTWMLQSRANIIKIIDPDIISPTNLNRIKFGWQDVGKYKVDIVKKAVLEINPYVNVISSKDITFQSMQKILLGDPKVQVIVDEIDDMESKVFLRKFASDKRIPVISAADVGDNVMLDVERYDTDPHTKFFLGRIPNIENIKFSELSDIERKTIIIKLIGFEQMSEKLLDTLLLIGKSIISWPQLGATAAMAGGIVATAIKKIILGENITSGRYYISLDEILVKNYSNKETGETRKQKIKQVKKRFNLE